MENLIRKLDLISLRLFVAVCQEKNIARAAEREFITPSAVSRRVAEIEALVGLPLIQRHARGISVTPAGDAVRRSALAIASNIEVLSAELSQFYSGAKGKVRVVANLSSIVQFLPEDIAAFGRLFPDVNIELEEHSSADAVRAMAERAADFGICNAVSGIEQFESLPYRTDRLFVMLPKHHRLAEASHLHLSELLAENFVGLQRESALMQLLERESAALGGTLNTRIRVHSLDAQCRMVHVGLGVTIVPQHVGELYVDTLDVVLRPLIEPWASRQLFLISYGQEQLSATAATLANFLIQRERPD
ncbi:LysR family transcriptional regulator [Paraburkholderia sp. BL21I4N1]|uniref:LysR family transcriptional regulator n=1 Tax=Paraburkholderia sp. BL21I4N1 TaxID=1938801 RepID=UPI000CFA942B|nr:LysR family transcriptional regulator [Paraburkholderia sp. BL21I4N1]PQV54003.1 transcriptional regulator [Paraburkholderia sp. BL21I4N1]